MKVKMLALSTAEPSRTNLSTSNTKDSLQEHMQYNDKESSDGSPRNSSHTPENIIAKAVHLIKLPTHPLIIFSVETGVQSIIYAESTNNMEIIGRRISLFCPLKSFTDRIRTHQPLQ